MKGVVAGGTGGREAGGDPMTAPPGATARAGRLAEETQMETIEMLDEVEAIEEKLNEAIEMLRSLAKALGRAGDSRVEGAMHSYIIPHLESWIECGALPEIRRAIQEIDERRRWADDDEDEAAAAAVRS